MPKPFRAKQRGQCADGSPQCGGIQVGDLIIKLETPAAFDMGNPAYQTVGKTQYYYLNYSHLKCYLASKFPAIKEQVDE